MAGPAHPLFRQAIESGKLPRVRTLAREMPAIGLRDAAAILGLICAQQPEQYERAAVRWLARYASERARSIEDLGRAIDTLDLMREDSGAVRTLEQLCTR